MASIVCEGAAGGRGGGTLFADITFFFLQRVPSRRDFIKSVEENGGMIAKFDKKADIIIGDHARKDTPAGAISWTFIDRSVKSGQLENMDDHRVGSVTRVVRDAGSRQPTKSGRTPFTAQDDRDLMLWVTKAERSGLAIKGNEIYMQLEAKNPRHTFQSWRDRWIKQLAHLPRPEIPDEEITAQDGNPVGSKYSNHRPSAGEKRHLPIDRDSDPAPSNKQDDETLAGRPKPIQTASKSVDSTPTDKPTAGKTNSILPLVRKSAGGMNFTEDEDQVMIDNYEVMAEADGEKGVEAWGRYANDNRNHSAQEWHNHFIQAIKPMMERRLSDSKKAATRDRKPPPVESPSPETTFKAPTDPIDILPAPRKLVDPSTEDETMFVEDLTAMAEENGIEVDFNPPICGREVRLFRLWQVVNMDKFGGYDEVNGHNLWPKVARELNFKDFMHAEAPQAIKAAYEKVLPDFETEREEFLEAMQEEADIASQLRRTAEHEDANEELVLVEEEEEDEDEFDDDLEAPASIPRPSSASKRLIDHGDRLAAVGSPVLGSSPKRLRLEDSRTETREVPSTPEDIIHPTPKSHSVHKTSPLKYMTTNLEDDDENGLFVPPAKKSKPQSLGQGGRLLEPETQDFGFLAADDDEESVLSFASLSNREKATVPSQMVDNDSSTQSQTDSQKNEELKAYIDYHQSIGYELEIVLAAIESTSMMTGNASVVMEELRQGHGVPANIQGVWTKEDDAALDDIESDDFERITRKHGTKSLVQRQKFLRLLSLE